MDLMAIARAATRTRKRLATSLRVENILILFLIFASRKSHHHQNIYLVIIYIFVKYVILVAYLF